MSSFSLIGLISLSAWLLMAASYAPMLRHYGRSPVEALLLLKAGLLCTPMTIDSARLYYRRGGNRWKGRDYGPAGVADRPAP